MIILINRRLHYSRCFFTLLLFRVTRQFIVNARKRHVSKYSLRRIGWDLLYIYIFRCLFLSPPFHLSPTDFIPAPNERNRPNKEYSPPLSVLLSSWLNCLIVANDCTALRPSTVAHTTRTFFCIYYVSVWSLSRSSVSTPFHMVRKTRIMWITYRISSKDAFAGSFSYNGSPYTIQLLYNSLSLIPSRYRSLRSMFLGKQSPCLFGFLSYCFS